MEALALPAVQSSLEGFKEKLATHQAKVTNLTELIQRLESNPELLRVMDLVRDANKSDY